MFLMKSSLKGICGGLACLLLFVLLPCEVAFPAPDNDFPNLIDKAEKSISYVKEFRKLYPEAKVERQFTYDGPSGYIKDHDILLMTVGLYGRYILSMQVRFQDASGNSVKADKPSFQINPVDRVEVSPGGYVSVFYDTSKGKTFDADGVWETLKAHGGDLSSIGYETIKNKPVTHFDLVWKKIVKPTL
jgi:hypothetical protein